MPVAYPIPAAVNVDGTALATAERTATTSSADLTNLYGHGGHFTFVVSAATAGATATFSLEGKDEVTDSYYNILTGAAVTAAATAVYRVFPGASAVANATVNDLVPTTFRTTVTHAPGTATYSVGYSLVE